MLTLFLRGGRSRKLILVRLGLLGVLLAVTFVFHVSGTALVEIRIARLLLVVALLVGVRVISRRRNRPDAAGAGPEA
jgi:hypothetical protein